MFRVLVLGLAFSCAACSSAPGPIGLAPSVQPVAMGELPSPEPADYTRPTRSYFIGPNDRISIEVFGVPELQREVQVDESGRLAFPLIGVIEAAGRRPADIAMEIERRLRGRYVKDPQVTINLKETTSQTLAVDGSVARPGIYPVTGRMTLQRAVAVAGGPTEFSDLDDVIIRRDVGGNSYIGLYNLGAIRRGNYKDPDVFPSDIIVVGESKQRRLFRDLLQILPLATTPLILLLQNGGN